MDANAQNTATIDFNVLGQIVAEKLALEQKNVLNIDEACKFLNIKKGSMYRLLCEKEIPHYKPRGKNIYFKRTELEDWALQGRVKTWHEIEQEAKDYCTTHKTAKK